MKRRAFCLIALITIGALWIASWYYDQDPPTTEAFFCYDEVQTFNNECSWVTVEDVSLRPWYAKMFHQYIGLTWIAIGALVIGLFYPVEEKKQFPSNLQELFIHQDPEYSPKGCPICKFPWMEIIGAEGHDRFFRCSKCQSEVTTTDPEFIKCKIGTILPKAATIPKTLEEPVKQVESETVKQESSKTKSVQCPVCKSDTTLRMVKKGKDAGKQFYVCIKYPKCKGRVQLRKGAL